MSFELENKYLVLKREHIEEALTTTESDMLYWLAFKVYYHNLKPGKTVSSYVVINQDEPYFPEVVKLLERHEVKLI